MNLVALLVVALVATPAGAAQRDWFQVASGSTGIKTSVDQSSIRRTGNLVAVWVRRQTPQADGPEKVTLAERIYDCTARTSRVKTIETVPTAGGTPERFSYTEAEAPHAPVGDKSVGAAVLDYVCAR